MTQKKRSPNSYSRATLSRDKYDHKVSPAPPTCICWSCPPSGPDWAHPQGGHSPSSWCEHDTVLMMDSEKPYFPAASHNLQSDSSTRIISIKAIPTRKQTPEFTVIRTNNHWMDMVTNYDRELLGSHQGLLPQALLNLELASGPGREIVLTIDNNV